MKLEIVQATHIDRAWKEGASCLAEACETSGGEVTGDQLKMLLSRNERHLVALKEEAETVGWGVFRIDQLPNMRVYFITDLYAPDIHFERFFSEVRLMAEAFGCSRVRCAAKPVQARLYQMKCGFKPVYTTLEIEV